MVGMQVNVCPPVKPVLNSNRTRSMSASTLLPPLSPNGSEGPPSSRASVKSRSSGRIRGPGSGKPCSKVPKSPGQDVQQHEKTAIGSYVPPDKAASSTRASSKFDDPAHLSCVSSMRPTKSLPEKQWQGSLGTQSVQKAQPIGRRSSMPELSISKSDSGSPPAQKATKMRHLSALADSERFTKAVISIQRMFRRKRLHFASHVAKKRAVYQEARARREKRLDSLTDQLGLSPRSKLRNSFTDVVEATRAVSNADMTVAVLSNQASRRRKSFDVMQRQWPKLLLLNAAKSHMQERRSSNSGWAALLK
eukprot:TRINITY_DN6814_c0_g1_i1.p1 TRINITY_DN6814_c0_g1~~TRINITY_DN6814_c0_g1_i1.p1  ORF type:complete len:306 (-),score=38.74 TRINITY_DN6814_c0_g1_i1:79-996(-)